VGGVLAAAVEGRNRNETNSGSGDEEDVMEGKSTSGVEMYIDFANPNCVDAGTEKPFDGVGCAWFQTFEVATLRGDIAGGPSIKDKKYF
jgi:hypothetical protein